MPSLVNFTKVELPPICLKVFKKFEEERIFPNLFYKATITLIPKPEKDTTRKKWNYSPISVMNIDAKILNDILANKNRQPVESPED